MIRDLATRARASNAEQAHNADTVPDTTSNTAMVEVLWQPLT